MYSASRSYNPRGMAGLDAFVIGGQSNAVGAGTVNASAETNGGRVYMLGADYSFKTAYEPTHDNTGDLDGILTSQGGHSAWLRMANSLATARNREILLVPCAKASTIIKHPDSTREQWLPWVNALLTGRTLLYGRLSYRAKLCPNVKAVCWVGHETSTTIFEGTTDLLSTYNEDWRALVTAVQTYISPIFIYAQLCQVQTGSGSDEIRYSTAHEYARRAESTVSGGIANAFMVTSFDLEMIDAVHMSAAAQKILGDRFARAIRANVYGESVAWRGPRLVASNAVSLTVASPVKITVQFDLAVNTAVSNYDSQFRVYNNGTELAGTITGTRAASTTAVELTWSGGNFPTGGTLLVTYGERLRASNTALANMVVDSNGLPAPAFRQTVTQL